MRLAAIVVACLQLNLGVRQTHKPCRRGKVFRISDYRLPKALHLALGLLIALEGASNLFHGAATDRDLQLIAFGAAEAVGAVLFLWPRTIAAGACILVCAFLVAAGGHVLGHDLPFEHLVYAVAVLIVVAHRKTPIVPLVSEAEAVAFLQTVPTGASWAELSALAAAFRAAHPHPTVPDDEDLV
jgi:hypothetical protein